MWVLIVEACVAFFLLVFIVWWTMYLGPKPPVESQQERKALDEDKPGDAPPQ